MNFCQQTIAAVPGLAPAAGVLSLAALRVTSDAVAAAARIRSDAQAQALHEHASAAERSRDERAALEAGTVAQAQSMLAELGQLQRRLLDQAGPIVADLAQALFVRLAGALAPADRLAAMLHQLSASAPPRLVDPVLRLHPADAALADTAPGPLPPAWRVEPDPALAPGRCRLEAASGEWQFDFDAAVLSLGAGLAAQAGPGARE